MSKSIGHRLLRSSTATAVLTLSSHAWFCAATRHQLGDQAAFCSNASLSRQNPSLQGRNVAQLNKRSMRMVFTARGSDNLTIEDDDWSNILPYEKSSHNSATITVPDEGNSMFDRNTFRDRLKDTVSTLLKLKKSSVWVEVPMSRASLIEEMVDLGFEFHHSQGKIANLNLWLVEDTESKVPEFATHHVGVGAVVINSQEEILCVRELRQNFMPWKVPGGLSELGESIPEAAEREVLEETGIPTQFRDILSFRHAHKLANGRSDLYFVCRLDPIEQVDGDGNAIIPEPFPQECEIEDTRWVPLSEYRDMVEGVDREHGHPMMSHIMRIYDQGIRIKQKEVKSLVPGRKPSRMYHPDSAGMNLFDQ